MELVWVVVIFLTALLLYLLYKRGYKNGATWVLNEWKKTNNSIEEDI